MSNDITSINENHKLTEEDLIENFKVFIKLIEKSFSGERKEKLLDLYSDEKYGYNVTVAPASARENWHLAHPGGYIQHIMHVVKASFGSLKLFKDMGVNIDFTIEEMLFSALHHDLGKLGDLEMGTYYLPNDSEWHIKNRGEVYKFNPALQYMDVTDRALFILQKQGIPLTWKETLGIKLSDGPYNENNKKYLHTFNPDFELKTNLPRVIHSADYISCRAEYDAWKNRNK